MKAFIGCDPGKLGGIAIVGPKGAAAFKMPETERDLFDLIESLKSWDDCTQFQAVVERVSSSPQMGVVSAFTFGRGYGALRMALIAAKVPLHEVLPQRWQKDMGCRTGGDKNVSKAKAQQLFPELKITHAIADSLLLAKWLSLQPQ